MPPKRKRDRASEAGGHRPSPHRPSDTGLAQHDRERRDGTPSHNRRRSGGGRNSQRNSDRHNSSNNQPSATPTRSAGSPPAPAARPSSSSSQPAPQANRTATPAPPQPTRPLTPIDTNFCYAVLTESRLSSWRQTGREEVIQHGIKSREDEDVEEISTISQEFTRAVLENRLDPIDAGLCMKQILGPEIHQDYKSELAFDAQLLFIDTLSLAIDGMETKVTKYKGHNKNPPLVDFVASIDISPKIYRDLLDSTALLELGLVSQIFPRTAIRYATNELYRQPTYNLLREESEGYSKLAAELYRTPYNREYDFPLVHAAWGRIQSLIGTFNLDAGRVLDVVIDVFSATMLRNIRFYTRFLRYSAWWPQNQIDQAERGFIGGLPKWALAESEELTPEELDAELAEQCRERDLTFWDRAREVHLNAFFELGGRRADEAELRKFENMIIEIKKGNPTIEPPAEKDIRAAWIKGTKTLPPPGNRVAAQLLGFKFRFYTSPARDKGETLPANLYYLAAFLIKIGFVSLPDLYPHLWPADEDMEKVRERRMEELEEKEKSTRQGSEPNALLRAGALTDDTLPSLPKPREAAPKPDSQQDSADAKAENEAALPEPKEAHKADLVTHLLVVGAIPEALFLIGRFPWLPDAYPDDIIPAINRIIAHSISKVYQETQPTSLRPVKGDLVKKDVSSNQSGMPKGDIRLVEGAPTKVLKWPHADGISKGVLYRFYLDEWSDNVPICQTVDDIFTLCSTLLNISGVNIGKDPALVSKIAAIGRKSLAQDQSKENLDRWQDLLRRLLVPCLSLSTANADAVGAVWDLLSHYPTQTRYNIYAECYEGQISRLPAMTKAFKAARLETLATLKRLSLTNISSTAKKMAKIALSSPGIVCKVALDQIEAYTNLIEAFIECTKYFTDLGYDVLVWSLLSSLGGKQRSRTQESSILLTSRWLQALSRFSGKVFRRFGNINPTPVLQYVNDQLSRGNSTDLIILRELINSMGGIVSDVDFTDAQLSALSGGNLLRRQTLIHLGDKRFEAEKSASRLMVSLEHGNLASLLLTNVAQYRQSAIFKLPENETHIKYLATVVDESQQTLVQYVELLRSNMTPEQFDAHIPSVPQLLTEFGLEPNLAFLIGRASLSYYMTGPGSKPPCATSGAITEVTDETSTDVNMTDDAPATAAIVDVSDPESMAIDTTEGKEKSPSQQSQMINGRKSDRFLDVLEPTITAIQTLLPETVWQFVSPEFFVLFWALQTGDLAVPNASYNAESKQVEKEINEVKRSRSDMSRAGEEKRNEKLSALHQVQRDLLAEANACTERLSKTKLLLIKQSPTWFPSEIKKAEHVADALIEECLMPRILLSPGDADFCHRMVKFLHMNQVPNFKLLSLYDRFFNVNRLRSMIFGCTVREADFLGRFIKLTLGDLSRWHKSKNVYASEAIKEGRLGFATAFDDNGKPTSYLDYDSFRDLLWTWHRNLSTALRSCLNGMEWMHIRNAITVLKAGLEYFPAVDFMGRQFQQILGKIAEREAASNKPDDEDAASQRVDLSVTANTALSALKKQSSKWVIVQGFRSNTTGDTAEEKKEVAKASYLRANAPNFKPTGAKKTPGEEEDGEVKDGKGGSKKDSAETRKDEPVSASTPAKDMASSRSSSVPQRPDPRPSSRGRSSTPKGAQPVPTPIARHDGPPRSVLGSIPGGKMHGLPSRPDVPFPAHFTHDKFGQISTRDQKDPRDGRETRDSRETRDPRELAREPREPRDTRETRSGRPVEEPRSSRGREVPTPDRRAPEALPRESSRSDRERHAHRPEPPPRWTESGPQERESRSGRERASLPGNQPRISESSRSQKDSPASQRPMAPPPHPDAPGPAVNPERARLINADRGEERAELMNPARAALLNDARPPGHSSRDGSRERNGQRGPSPRRGERPDPRSAEQPREERSSRSHRSEAPRDHRNDSVSGGPRGPKGAEPNGDWPMNDKPRETSAHDRANPRGDPEHGRLANQDPEYGRLSAIPSITDMNSQPPEGPRGRGRNVARSASNVPSRPDSRYPGDAQRQPSPPSNQPPTGPASSRPRRGQPSGQFESAQQHGSPHGNPQAPPGAPASGVHPDRLRHLSGGARAGLPPPQSFPGPSGPPPNAVPVHPDRMSHLGSPAGSPSGPPQRGRPLPPPIQTEQRPPPQFPGGHRQASGSQPAPGPNNGGQIMPPTGPSSGNDRSRTGGRKQLADINSALQGGPSRNRNNARQTVAGSDAQVLTGGSPVSTPVSERMEPVIPNDRGTNGNERSSRHESDRSRRDHGGSERSTRSSHRERSPGREHRDRKSGSGHSSREGERESSRRSGRDSQAANRDMLPPGGGSGGGGRAEQPSSGRDGGRESRHRDGGSGRHDDHGRGGGGGGRSSSNMGGGPRGDERQESRSTRDERSRKRQSDEGFAVGPSEKRRRR